MDLEELRFGSQQSTLRALLKIDLHVLLCLFPLFSQLEAATMCYLGVNW